ncbi:uncharacterized protein LY89DRAFT_11680 [Mollisia scopiformis]|uniref:Uncharacterized protein n=1 Tax=Mollisia scopiformis TaxID=149040 RepID=A0A194XWH8_MOLSC|nr:uncharacterized protein LY89DRAFT_11680 [Mollisia scopiformis]KUJ24082.1 hypothetical protein LY89DRAFT_11680 [Mollisia scopiformis]
MRYREGVFGMLMDRIATRQLAAAPFVRASNASRLELVESFLDIDAKSSVSLGQPWNMRTFKQPSRTTWQTWVRLDKRGIIDLREEGEMITMHIPSKEIRCRHHHHVWALTNAPVSTCNCKVEGRCVLSLVCMSNGLLPTYARLQTPCSPFGSDYRTRINESHHDLSTTTIHPSSSSSPTRHQALDSWRLRMVVPLRRRGLCFLPSVLCPRTVD